MTGLRRGRRSRALILLVALAAAGLVACDGHHDPNPEPTGPGASPSRPNIVFVLTDDLAWNLVQYMPHVRALQHNGMTFTNYTVTDSLCCPSRASIFTGEFPHDTHVVSNESPDGGVAKFRDTGDQDHTFATSLKAAGYRTALLGKYLNPYSPAATSASVGPFLGGAYVPPGWTTWNGVGNGYYEYDYPMAKDHAVAHYGHAPDDYLTSVVQHLGQDYIESSAKAKTPFLLEVATFAPHQPATPAPQDVGTFPGLKAPRTPAFGVLPANSPPWLAAHPLLNAPSIRSIDRLYQKRVESVQSVDRMIGALETTLRRTGQSKNTTFIFSSDNGFHMGEYTLRPGKQTAFDTDVRVPLVVAGPGVPADTTSSAVVENIDLAPTFDELAGARTPAQVDGRSLVPLLQGEQPAWRTVAGIEHKKPAYMIENPDNQNAFQGVPPSYDAIRSARYTYVRYHDGEREYYDRVHDPDELNNLAGTLSATRLAQLDRIVDELTGCHGQASCWAAARPSTG